MDIIQRKYKIGNPSKLADGYLILATSASPTTNRRKFGGKELATDLGLNLHDFTARWQNPALGRFTTPDPLSEKYCHNSLYSFCAGDPINYIDPTGMKWLDSNTYTELLKLLDKRILSLKNNIDQTCKSIDENRSVGKSVEWLEAELNEFKLQLSYVKQAKSDIQTLENDLDNTYNLMQIDDGGGAHKVKMINGIVYIQYSGESLIFHEAAHIRQSLQQNGRLRFMENELVNPGSIRKSSQYFYATRNEIEAYRIQYSYSSFSMPNSVSGISDISIEY